MVPGIPSGVKSAVEVAKHAEKVGAEAVLVFPPHGASEEGLYRYYRKIADSVSIGLMPFILGSLETALFQESELYKQDLGDRASFGF